MASAFSISDLRREFGDTLEAFGVRLGIRSKGHVSQIENGAAACSFDIALKLEELSGGRIDAAALNADVARARAGLSGSNMDAADSAAETTGRDGIGARLTTPPVIVPEDGLSLTTRRVA